MFITLLEQMYVIIHMSAIYNFIYIRMSKLWRRGGRGVGYNTKFVKVPPLPLVFGTWS